MKAKNLQGLKLDTPPLSNTARMGSLDRKGTTYDLWSLGDEPDDNVGGDELKTLTPLLPRKKKGTRFYAGA